jgi:hypothetical protein
VWTPKRILLLVSGFGLFCLLFTVYSLFLGGLDGIMPLPQEFWPRDNVEPITVVPVRENEAVKKLKIAFGPESKEIKDRLIKLTIPARGMVLATDKVEIQKDGRVKIEPFSVALFGKDKGDGSLPEINTVQADEAYLTLDRPISNQFEMSNRKIVGGELRNNIHIINNRGTPQKNDDITIWIQNGPVFYEEKGRLIWTKDHVTLEDWKSKPEPTRIQASGMEVHLVPETPQAKQARAKEKTPSGTESVSGVEKVVLNSSVDMHLWVDARSGFLGPPEKKSDSSVSTSPAAPEPEKSHVVIKTNGPFVYHVQKDLASFDSPEPAESSKAQGAAKSNDTSPRRAKLDSADLVCVLREHREGQSRWLDQLLCDHLDLQFRPKPRPNVSAEARPISAADKSGDREIDTALATARPGNEVVMLLDQECVEAYGNKLHYTAPRGQKGARTLLTGTPLKAFKEGHKITAVEMVLVSANGQGDGQSAEAAGPGEIHLFDKAKKPGENQYPCHARWKDKLVLTKDKVGGKVYDLLTLTTDAAFVDDDHKQELIGQRLQVWFEPGGTSGSSAKEKEEQTSGLLSRQRPYKIEAQGQVRIDSPELCIPECQNFIVVFHDVPPALPDALPSTAPTTNGGAARLTLKVAPPDESPTPRDKPATPAATVEIPHPGPIKPLLSPPSTVDKTPPKNAPRPITMGARTVRANVLRGGEKNELQSVYSQGDVKVHQDGNGPKDKGVNICGEILQLDRDPTGDKLQVFGDGHDRLAELQLGELILIGPKVVIDQRDNTANVYGLGTMDMPSNTTFEGGKPAKEGARLTVNWNSSMFFDGQNAYYDGGVVAYQVQKGLKDKARLQASRLHVTLDRHVSLKEGQKAGESAKVDKLVCDRQVDAVNITFDAQGKMLQFHRMENPEMNVDNQQNLVRAAGPGRVSILQYGAPDALVAPKSSSGKQSEPIKKQADVLKLTRVLYAERLYSRTVNGGRISYFYRNVQVFHLPADDPDVKIDLDKLPKNGFYMRSEYLEVLSRSGEDKSKGQYMRATTAVEFRTPEFYGKSDKLTYNESTETVLFEGTEGNPARVYRSRGPGARWEEISGQQILYNRNTGLFTIVKGNRISS